MISLTSMLCADDISYKLVSDFPQWPAGMKSGAVSGVAIDATGEIVVAHRSGPPISIFTKEGVHIRSFGEKIFASVHGVRVDGDNHIWATDMKWHIVVKMEMTGRVLMTLGERDVPGDDKKHFNRPTDVAIASNGDIFVADGYGNSRIVKFDRDGKFLKSWGGRGTGKGLLHLPHAMVIDARAQIYVADRENNRIQVFDIEGGFIRQFGGFTPYGLCLGPDEKLYVADGRKNKVMRMSREGEVDVAWGMKAGKSGDFDLPHGIAVGADGSVYIAEINGERLRKYEPH
ncbi:MAG: peptidyl-alpha-hydroxyglycine alpha-amidating lyase family protein [Verrucomicrobiaceae bacterium]